MALRKLTRKSTLGFGRHALNTIQKVIDEDPQYIVWIYYNSSEITFFNDILEEVGLVDDYTIDKPGTNPEKFWDDEGRKKLFVKPMTEQERGMNRKRRNYDKKSAVVKEGKWESKGIFKSKSMGNPVNFK